MASDPILLRRLQQIRYRDPRFEKEYGFFPIRSIATRAGIDRRRIWRACMAGTFGCKHKEFVRQVKPVVDAIFDRKLVAVMTKKSRGRWPELFDSDIYRMRLYK